MKATPNFIYKHVRKQHKKGLTPQQIADKLCIRISIVENILYP